MSHPFTPQLHEILLRVAGRLPDDTLTRARRAVYQRMAKDPYFNP